MLDRMVIKAKIPAAKVPGVIERCALQLCVRGARQYWQSSAYGRFDAMFVTIDGQDYGGTSYDITVKMSLHKHYYKACEGRLDNSGLFTLTQAEDALLDVIELFGLSPTETRVTYYEVGLNLPMSDEPMEYIRLTLGSVGKEMFIDANYEKDRQRTTARTRNMRKVLKIYDKTFEAAQKGHTCPPNILRCETIYRHQRLILSELFSPIWQRKTLELFWRDWSNMQFERVLTGRGVKESQLSHARDLLRLGEEEFLRRNRKAFQAGDLTKKQWETKRNFARAWPDLRERFTLEPSAREREYLCTLSDQLRLASE